MHAPQSQKSVNLISTIIYRYLIILSFVYVCTEETHIISSSLKININPNPISTHAGAGRLNKPSSFGWPDNVKWRIRNFKLISVSYEQTSSKVHLPYCSQDHFASLSSVNRILPCTSRFNQAERYILQDFLNMVWR